MTPEPEPNFSNRIEFEKHYHHKANGICEACFEAGKKAADEEGHPFCTKHSEFYVRECPQCARQDTIEKVLNIVSEFVINNCDCAADGDSCVACELQHELEALRNEKPSEKAEEEKNKKEVSRPLLSDSSPASKQGKKEAKCKDPQCNGKCGNGSCGE